MFKFGKLAILALLCASGQTSATPLRGFERALLEEHNSARAAVGVAPLAWSDELEAEARQWAEELAERGSMAHADMATRRGAGENLWEGATGYYGPQDMVGLFVSERRMYRHAAFPDVSTSGDWRDVGHYTQVIWRETRQVGCAIAEGETEEFLVCRYWPAGNYRGQMAY